MTAKGERKLKVRGITLGPSTIKHLNFDVVRDIVREHRFGDRVPVPQGTTIRRVMENMLLETVPRHKDYRAVYTKRVVLADLSTLPFGFCAD